MFTETRSNWSRLWAHVSLLCLLLQLTLPLTSPAQESAIAGIGNATQSPPAVPADTNSTGSVSAVTSASGPAAPVDLDLSSSLSLLSPQSIPGFQPGTNIQVGELSRSVLASDKLTAAELLAASQVILSGTQTLLLNDQGTAVGGTFNLHQSIAGEVGNLVIPSGVSALHDFAAGNPLNMAGNLSNSGQFYAYSSNEQSTSAIINAQTITNMAGATLSSALPANLAATLNLTGLVPALNLSLNATNITNYGTVSSSAALAMTAVQNISNYGTIVSAATVRLATGDTISNLAGAASTAANASAMANSATLAAVSNILMSAQNILNQGKITAQSGNIEMIAASLSNNALIEALGGSLNIKGTTPGLLLFDNVLGTLSARDKIAFFLDPTLAGASLLRVEGGTLLANSIDFSAPGGKVFANTERMSGGVSVTACDADLRVQTGVLKLNRLNLSGDPVFTSGGELDLSSIFSGGPTSQTLGGDFIALASGKIFAATAPPNAVIDATKDTPQFTGGRIQLAAGVTFSGTTVTGVSSTGGDIILPTVNLRTNSNEISLEAHAGNDFDGAITVGSLEASGAGGAPADYENLVNGYQGADGGNVTISASDAVSTGFIRSYGGGGGGYADTNFGTVLGGDGGDGGNVSITAGTSVLVSGDINVSGGGSGGGNAQLDGGDSGNIAVNAGGTFTATGPLLAVGGQNYGAGSFGGGGGGRANGTPTAFGGASGFIGGGAGVDSTPGWGGGIFGGASLAGAGDFGRGGNSAANFGTNEVSWGLRDYDETGNPGDVSVQADSVAISGTVNSYFSALSAQPPATNPFTNSRWKDAAVISRNFEIGTGTTAIPPNTSGQLFALTTYTSAGNLDLTQVFQTPRNYIGGFAALAGADITAIGPLSTNLIDTTNTTNSYMDRTGGKVVIVAGVDYTATGAGQYGCDYCYRRWEQIDTLPITGTTASGGSVSLPNIDIRSNSGYVSLYARSGSASTGSVTIRDVNVSPASSGAAGYINISASGSIAMRDLNVSTTSGDSGQIILDSGINSFTVGSILAFGSGGGDSGFVLFKSNNDLLPLANVSFVSSGAGSNPVIDIHGRSFQGYGSSSGLSLNVLSGSIGSVTIDCEELGGLLLTSPGTLNITGAVTVDGEGASIHLSARNQLFAGAITSSGDVTLLAGTTGGGSQPATDGRITISGNVSGRNVVLVSMGDPSISPSSGNVSVSGRVSSANEGGVGIVATKQINIGTGVTSGALGAFLSAGAAAGTAIASPSVSSSTGDIILLSATATSGANPTNISVPTVSTAGGAIRYGYAGAGPTLPLALNVTPTAAINIKPGGYTTIGSIGAPISFTLNTGTRGKIAPIVATGMDAVGNSMYIGTVTQFNSNDSLSMVAAGNISFGASINSGGYFGLATPSSISFDAGAPISITAPQFTLASGAQIVLSQDLTLNSMFLRLHSDIRTNPSLPAVRLTLVDNNLSDKIYISGSIDLRGASGSRGDLEITAHGLFLPTSSSIEAGTMTINLFGGTGFTGDAVTNFNGHLHTSNLALTNTDSDLIMHVWYGNLTVDNDFTMTVNQNTDSGTTLLLETQYMTLNAGSATLTVNQNVAGGGTCLCVYQEVLSTWNITGELNMTVTAPPGPAEWGSIIDFETYDENVLSAGSIVLANYNGEIFWGNYGSSYQETTTGGISLIAQPAGIEVEVINNAHIISATGIRIEASENWWSDGSHVGVVDHSSLQALNGDIELINTNGSFELNVDDSFAYAKNDIIVTAIAGANSGWVTGFSGGDVIAGRNIIIEADTGVEIGYSYIWGASVRVSSLSAGEFAAGFVPATGIQPANSILTNGRIQITSPGPIWVNQDTHLTVSGGINWNTPAEILIESDDTLQLMNRNQFTAWGGDIILRATTQISIDDGVVLSANSKLDDAGGTYVNVNDVELPNYAGGRIAVLAGVPASAMSLIPTRDVFTAANTWVPPSGSPTTDTEPLSLAYGTNTIDITDFGYVQFYTPDKSGIDINGSTLSTSGGIIYIDPLGGPDPLFIGNASFLTAAPATVTGPGSGPGPGPGPGPNQPSGPLTHTTPPVESVATQQAQTQINVERKNETLSNTVLQTDTAKRTMPIVEKSRCESLLVLDAGGSAADDDGQTSWMVAGGGCQVYSFQYDLGSALLAAPGTTMAPAGNHSVRLGNGKLVALAAKKPINIASKRCKVTAKPDTIALVNQTSRSVTRVTNLDGHDVSVALGVAGKVQTVTAHKGQEIVICDENASEEDLIAVDGVDRGPITGVLRIAGYKVQTYALNLEQMANKESSLLSCGDNCLRVAMKQQLKKIRDKIQHAEPDAVSEAQPDCAPSRTLPAPITSSGLSGPIHQLVPVALRQPHGTSRSSSEISRSNVGLAELAHTNDAKFEIESNGVFNLYSGELLIQAKQQVFMRAGDYKASIAPGALVLVAVAQDRLIIRNLWDTRHDSVQVYVGKHCTAVNVGEEVIIASGKLQFQDVMLRDNIGRRRAHSHELTTGHTLVGSDISLLSLIQSSDILHQMLKSSQPSDRKVLDRLLKATACLVLTTGRRGAYGVINPQ
jgi:hypothetical protein